MSAGRSVLLLCRTNRHEAGNVADHVRALSTLSVHEVHTFNPVDRPGAAALLDLGEFDAVVVHYTIATFIERYFPQVLRDKIASFDGLKVQFIQDEYRHVDAVTTLMRELGIDVLFTCVPERELPKVYGRRVPGLKTVTTLPGYVPDDLVGRRVPPIASRPTDVSYRGRTIPYWLGRLAYEKVAIGDGFLARSAEHGLRCDISSAERDRIYGEAWLRFISSSKATLGTESGASITDFDGSIEVQVRDYLVRRPDASFDDVERDILAPYEGSVVINTVSPRVFEAAALRTAMVLFPGEYSGTVEPWRHYIPLEKDFSNMAVVAERIRDVPFLEELTEQAHADLITSGRYSLRRLVEQLDDLIAAETTGRAPARKPAFARAERRSRLPSTADVARARYVAGKAAQPIAMAALTARDAPVRALARLATREQLRDGLAGDLWRLAALRRAARAGLFQIVAAVEDEGRRLVLTSRTGGADPRLEQEHAARTALQSGLLSEIIWNHSGVGSEVPLIGSNLLRTRVGEHGVSGAYSFGPLLELARRTPQAVADAFAPLLAGRNGAPPADRRAPGDPGK